VKILLIGNAASIHIRRWATSLAGRGLEVAVLSRKQVPIEGVQLLSAKLPPWSLWRLGNWAQRRRGLLRGVLRRVRPDVVNVHFLGRCSAFPEDLGDTRLLVNTWGSDVIPLGPEPAVRRAHKIHVLRTADRLMATSHDLARATSEYAGVPLDDITVNHWGVDLEAFRPTDRPADEPIIGFVKSLEAHYGPHTLLEAFVNVRQAVPQAKLMMIGVGSKAEELRQLACRLNVDDGIDWLGSVEYRRIPQLFARMAVSAMPSTREAFGMAAIESQAMGVPVVGSTAGGIPEVIDDGETGLLVPPEDPEALADALVRLLADREFRLRLGRQGRAHVEANFDWNATVDRMVAVYEEMVGSRECFVST